MNQLGPDNINHLKQIADSMNYPGGGGNPAAAAADDDDDDDDDVPDLVENFEDVSNN